MKKVTLRQELLIEGKNGMIIIPEGTELNVPNQPPTNNNQPYGGWDTEDGMNLSNVFMLDKVEIIDNNEVSRDHEIEPAQRGGTTDPSWDAYGTESVKYEISFSASVANAETGELIDLSRLNLGEDPIEALRLMCVDADMPRMVLEAAKISRSTKRGHRPTADVRERSYDEITKDDLSLTSFNGHLIKGTYNVDTVREMDDSDIEDLKHRDYDGPDSWDRYSNYDDRYDP